MSRRTWPLQLEITARTGKAMVPFLKWYVPRAVELAGGSLRELSIVVVTDTMIKALHQRFFGDPATTDVITFPLELDGRGHATSGEVYICLSMARRQAKVRRIPVRHELLLYAVHGILHLNGYDDLTKRAYKKMHEEEDRILERLGLGRVFGQPIAADGRKARR